MALTPQQRQEQLAKLAKITWSNADTSSKLVLTESWPDLKNSNVWTNKITSIKPMSATPENPLVDKTPVVPPAPTSSIPEFNQTTTPLVWSSNASWKTYEQQVAEAQKWQLENQLSDQLLRSWDEYRATLWTQRSQLEWAWKRTMDTLTRSLALRWWLRWTWWANQMAEVQNLVNEKIWVLESNMLTAYQLQDERIKSANANRVAEIDKHLEDIAKKSTDEILSMLTWHETADELKIISNQFKVDPVKLALKTRQLKETKLTDTQKQQSIDRDKAFDNLLNFAQQWVDITPDFAKSLFTWTWVADYWNMALMANGISKLKWEEKQLWVDKLKAEIEKVKAEVLKKDTLAQTTEAKNFEYYAELYKKDPVMAQSFADMAGIDTTQYQWWQGNPEVIAKVQDIPNWQVYNYKPNDPFSGECWRFVNDILWKPWLFWNTIESKTNKINSQTPEIWSIAIWWDNLWDNGHVSIVTWINQDWTINVKESGYNRSPMLWWKRMWLVWERKNIDPKYTKVLWYYNPSETSLTDVDISKFNDSKLDQNKLKWNQKSKYSIYINEKNKVMSNPDVTVDEILKYSKWWKDLTDTPITQLSKYNNAISSMQEIKDLFDKQATWPVIWRLKGLNPYDINAQALEAAINAAIPNLARWVYGEVWVLTDQDVALYKKTLPNIASTSEVSNAVLALTLRKISNWYKWILQAQAWAGRDVSWFIWAYRSLEKQIKTIEDKLPKEWGTDPLNLWITIKKPKSDPLNLFN